MTSRSIRMRHACTRPCLHVGVALVLAGASAGCGSSALIRPDDPTFARSAAKLERTTADVEASGASPRERVLFLQAEAFYRYRFTIEARGAAAVAAEAAGAITDFPVFQSLAGSLDFVDIRMRSADAAVQLWEGFLLRYPESKLRPLTLYRLGFAYRNVSATGLPRESGDEAWRELCLRCAPPRIADGVTAARDIRWKSKETAAKWSIVPGLGQFYVDNPVGGSVRLGVAMAAAAAIVVPAVIGLTRSSELTWGNDWPLLVSAVGGLVVLSFDYTSSYEDAMRGVVRWNEREEAKFEDEHPDAP